MTTKQKGKRANFFTLLNDNYSLLFETGSMFGELPLHPLFVHIPIAQALLAPFLGLGMLLLNRKYPELKISWGIIIIFQFILVATVYSAMATGDMDAQKISRVINIKKAITAHEDIAGIFFLVSLATFFLSLIAFKVSKISWHLRLGTIAAQIVLLGLCVRVAHLGGLMVYKFKAAEAHQKILDDGHSRERTLNIEKTTIEKKK